MDELDREWSKGILTDQDHEFMEACKLVTDILTMDNANPLVQNKILGINAYLQKYCIPDGFKERMMIWNNISEE